MEYFGSQLGVASASGTTALHLARMERIDWIIDPKRKIAQRYIALLGDVAGVTLPIEEPWAKDAYWMYCLLIEDGFEVSRYRVTAEISERGVETRTFSIGMHARPAFHDMRVFIGQQFPVADKLAERGLDLNSRLDLTDEEIAYVRDSLTAIQSGSCASG